MTFREVLFADPNPDSANFEVSPGGHSTLERHQHVHAVMILPGTGRCSVGDLQKTVMGATLWSERDTKRQSLS